MSPSAAFSEGVQKVEAGTHVRLKHGDTWAVWLGPETGPVVVCVHGITVPSVQFYHLGPALAAAGFRVLLYDAWGRGKSSAPDLPYDGDTFVDQLHELVQALKIQPPFRLVGVSLGGAVSTLYADKHGADVSHLVLVDSAGLPIAMPFVGRLSLCPVLGDLLWYAAGKAVMLSRLKNEGFRSEYYDSEKCRDAIELFAARVEEQILHKEGFLNAFRKTMVNFPMETMQPVFERVAQQRVGGAARPTLLVWGENDSLIPLANGEALQRTMPHARLLAVQRAGHLPHIEQPEEVLAAILACFRGTD